MSTHAENMFLEYRARFEETKRDRDDLQQECERKRAELEESVSKLAIIQARFDEGRIALETIEAFRSQSGEAASNDKPKRKQKRGRPMSDNWQAIFLEFPVAPEPVIPVTDVYKISEDLGIDYDLLP